MPPPNPEDETIFTRGDIERLVNIETVVKALLERLKDQEQRLRQLERWQRSLPIAALSSTVAAIAAIAGILQ